jgi:hypothetical protein
MQALSGMQRNLLDQKPVNFIALLLLFAAYESMSSIYLQMPPLLGILFFIYIRSLEEKKTVMLLLISLMLLFFEAEKGYLFGSSVVYFTLVYFLLIPKIEHNIHCKACRNMLLIVLAYIGFWLFYMLISKIFLLEYPELDWYVPYYIIVEFLVVSLL